MKEKKRKVSLKRLFHTHLKSIFKLPIYSMLLGSLVAGASERYINFSITKGIEELPKNYQKLANILEEQFVFLPKENPLSIIYKNRKEKIIGRASSPKLHAINHFSQNLLKINSKDVFLGAKEKLTYVTLENTQKKLYTKDIVRRIQSAINKKDRNTSTKTSIAVNGLINFPVNNPPRSGHFEIGFYEGIGRDGEPIGAPVVQSILKHGKINFSLNIPINLEGYLFAFYSGDEYSKSWFGYPSKISLNRKVKAIHVQIPIEASNVVNVSKTNNFHIIRGRVNKMFYSETENPAIENVLVRIRGTKMTTQTDSDGLFELHMPKLKGSVLLEFLKLGYSPRIEKLTVTNKILSLSKVVELISTENINKMAALVGLEQASDRAVLIIKTTGKNKNEGLPGISMQLSLEAEGPYYFSNHGGIDDRIESTSFDGRAIFFNVKKGVGFLETFILGENTVPTIVSSLGDMELIHKNLSFYNQKIRGRLLNPIKLTKEGNPSPIIGARVRISGSSQWTETDLFGYFELPDSLYVSGSKIILEFSAVNYYKHRYQLKIPLTFAKALSSVTLYAFPIKYINSMANSMSIKLNPNTGIIIGQAPKGKELQINTLLDHSNKNKSMDFYFDQEQNIQNHHFFTNRNYGTYAVFNIANGRGIIKGHDKTGTLRYSDIVHLSSSTITVLTSK